VAGIAPRVPTEVDPTPQLQASTIPTKGIASRNNDRQDMLIFPPFGSPAK
jgi:hypothetical protein